MQAIKPYEHKALYYETDQMGIIHHSNYVRWLESARLDFFEQIGMPYDKVEELGVISPVLSVSCQYKNMVHYSETVEIHVKVKAYNGIRLTLEYEIFQKETKKLCTTGESSHCFLKDGKPLLLAKAYPQWHELLKACLPSA